MNETHFTVEPGKHAIKITRLFDAPPQLVYKAYTDPQLVPQWWGPRRYTTTVDRMEVHQGGIWRYVQRDSAGNEFAFHGVYHDAIAPERLVYTFEFEGMPGHIALETVTLANQSGKTLVTDLMVFQSVEDRDGMVQSGMQEGASESLDRIAELLVRV
jgi:uncharacterized protein YndB with AHSA1/START domain